MTDETLPRRLTEKNETITKAERAIVELQQKIEEIKNLFSEGKYADAESASESLKDLLRTMHSAIRVSAENEDFKIFKVGCTYKAVDFNSDGSKEYYFFTVVSRTKDTVTVTSSYYDWIPDGKLGQTGYTWESWQFDEELGKAKITLDLYHHTYDSNIRAHFDYPRVAEYFWAYPFVKSQGPSVYSNDEEEVSDE